jgi:signal transduction histidine kinase
VLVGDGAPFRPPLSAASVLFLVTGAVLLAVAATVVRSDVETPTARYFVVLLVADAVWALSGVVPLEAGTFAVGITGEVVRVAASGGAALAWFAFTLVYSGRGASLTRGRLAALTLPLVVHVLAFATNPVHGLSATGVTVSVAPGTTVVGYELGPTYLVASLYALSLVVLGATMVVESALRDPDLFVDQSVALVVAAAMPVVGVGLTLTGTSVPGVGEVGRASLAPATLSFTAVAFGYALLRTDVLTASPVIVTEGREVAVESLDEGFLVVDAEGRVVEANAAARRLLAVDRVAGKPLETALPATPGVDDEATSFRHDDGTVVEARVAAAPEKRETWVLTLRDVTQQRRRRERLQVLNRVLRHNLRNDLNVIRGFAREIANDGLGDRDEQTVATLVADRADDLLEVAENARTLERLLDVEGTAETEPIAVRSLVEDLVEDVAADDDRPIEVTTDVEVDVVRSNEAVLEMVLEELLRNAVEHNDRAEPTVRVAASADESVRLRVVDDGPGVPAPERRAVLSGTETALEHGSRLGLWMVRWGVRYLGGELVISDREPTGTVVEVRLPDAVVDPATDTEGAGGDPAETASSLRRFAPAFVGRSAADEFDDCLAATSRGSAEARPVDRAIVVAARERRRLGTLVGWCRAAGVEETRVRDRLDRLETVGVVERVGDGDARLRLADDRLSGADLPAVVGLVDSALA